ncbi:MAG: hypothetical protein JSR33_08610 [Proteobacteria bacterium]|nr:hypothetical protein [Pseudomonadota bacterium]
MKRWVSTVILSAHFIFLPSVGLATTFECPILLPNELYFNLEWVLPNGQKVTGGSWNTGKWRIWINGDSYLTPVNALVITTPLAAHYFATTGTWYLKCTSSDLNIGPRINVWPYTSCNMTKTGFDCENPLPHINVPSPASTVINS